MSYGRRWWVDGDCIEPDGEVALVRLPRSSNQERLTLPCRIEGIDLPVSAAIGVAIYPEQAATAVDLLKVADQSMYRAKAQVADCRLRRTRSEAPSRRRDDGSKRRFEA